MSVLLRDLIDIPEHVAKGDFVLRLASGVERADETLSTYVVTEQLARCFDDALRFVGGALEQRQSKAAYLHGSFGSGKSHFMAVLHLLLQGNPRARGLPELAAVVAKHGWTEGKRFLLVPYHMIGARSMEAAVLGGYVDHIRRTHPEAPLPGVYLSERLLEDARRLRDTMGDAAFFAALSAGADGGGDWGELEHTWDAPSFADAIAAPPHDPRREALVAALIAKLFSAYGDVAEARGEGFVSLDDGLAIASRHAQGLGYDALILFLDELILWLASHAADLRFVQTEGQKLVKLIEAGNADRPISIVSFVARQRDLRELVGQHVTGAEQLRFADVLSHWEGRFHTIRLEDRNLPEIASRRLLRPRSESARQAIDDAFGETQRVRSGVLDVLMTKEADREAFRKVYPFSPALVDTLVAVSSALQRERTALKVMLQLLVDQRETLELGQMVPVGDLFDEIAEGDEPFIEGMRVRFEQGKRLWRQKLLPLLEAEHGLRESELASLAYDDPKARALRNDGRLLKTLIVAALVPEAHSLRGLTPERLAALNYGTIRSPIPGQEGSMVLQRMRKWAARVGELKVGDEPTSPSLAIRLVGVDTQSIVENAKAADNPGNRRRKVRELLFRELGIGEADGMFIAHEIVWRGTRRRFEVLYDNVCDLPDDSLRAKGDPRVVIDFPFDPEGGSALDDVARLERLRQGGATRTLVWLPSFLKPDAQHELGQLVVLDDLLAGERFEQCAAHLAQVDRVAARPLLEDQRSQLRQRVVAYLETAYGVSNAARDAVVDDLALADHFQPLDPAVALQPPVGANLGQAFQHLLSQVLDSYYPDHPHLEGEEAKGARLAAVLEHVERALAEEYGRVHVEKQDRKLLREIAVPLGLGEMGENHFVLGRRWLEHFDREHARDGGGITAGKLREWTDRPRPRGLTRPVQDLLILAFALQANRSFFLHGGAYPAKIGDLRDELELRTQSLPDPETWVSAERRAAAIFGIVASKLLNASNVSGLAADLVQRATARRPAGSDLVKRLEPILRGFGLDPEATPRLQTARAARSLVESLVASGIDGAVEALASAAVATSEAAMGSSLAKAQDLLAALDGASWKLLEEMRGLAEGGEGPARRVVESLREALAADELAVGLAARLRQLESDAVDILGELARSRQPAARPDPQPVQPGGRAASAEARSQSTEVVSEGTVLLSGREARQKLEEIERVLERHPQASVQLSWRVTATGRATGR